MIVTEYVRNNSRSHYIIKMSSGVVVIKVTYNEVTRKLPLRNEDITYDEFLIMMQRVFKNTLSSTDDITIKYIDEDNDLITIVDTEDLQYAVSSTNQCLKIMIENSTKNETTLSSETLEELMKSFSCLKTSVDSFSQNLKSVLKNIKEEQKEAIKPHNPESRNTSRQLLNDFDPIVNQNMNDSQRSAPHTDLTIQSHLKEQPMTPQPPQNSTMPQRYTYSLSDQSQPAPQSVQPNQRMSQPPTIVQTPPYSQDQAYNPSYYRPNESNTQMSQISTIDNPASSGVRRAMQQPPPMGQGNWQQYHGESGQPQNLPQNATQTGLMQSRPPNIPQMRQPYPPQGMGMPQNYRPGPPPVNMAYSQGGPNPMQPQYNRYPPPQGTQQPPAQ